jgi:tetratricopeptide (TPR) repeat protein
MARGASHHVADTLPDLDGGLDGAAHWVQSNPVVFLTLVGIVLAVTGAIGLTRWHQQRSELQAAEAVAEVRTGFLKAMGAPPGSRQFAEPANAETARSVREQYAGRFAEAAAAHPGTAAAVDAWLEAGNLRARLGDADAASEAFQHAVEESPADSPLRGLALLRVAAGDETRGDFAAAAAAYEDASKIDSFPLRNFALASAARAFADAGQLDHARELAEHVDSESAEAKLPAYLEARIEELRAE